MPSDNDIAANVFHGDNCPFIERPCPYIALMRAVGRKLGESVPSDAEKAVAETIKEAAIVAHVVADELVNPNASDERLKQSAKAMAEADRKIIEAANKAP